MNRPKLATAAADPDTEAGAIAILDRESDHDTRAAFAVPDPVVAGVWKVTLPHDHFYGFEVATVCIVYTASGDFESAPAEV